MTNQPNQSITQEVLNEIQRAIDNASATSATVATGTTAAAGAGAKLSAWSFGLKHSF